MTQPGSPSVAHWEIFRDGALITQATSPRASDVPAGPGSYAYAVVAVGADGRRSAESAAWTALVPADTGTDLQPQPPQVPTGLSGSSTGSRVDLRWDPAASGSIGVARWEVLRDGAMITEATSPSASDEPPGPGSYAYTVIAVGDDGQRSPQSASWVRHGQRRWLVLVLAILATLLAAAGLIAWDPWGPNGTGPPVSPVRPAGLAGEVSDTGTEITLRWDPAPPDSAAVARWEVRRDGEVVAEVTEPQVVDAVPGPGSYSYTLVAVGEDGQQSAESEAWIATVPAPPPAPLAWTSVPDGFQEPISNAGVAAHNGELWVVGGVSGSGSKRTSVRVFNPQTGWGNGPELPIGVSHAPLVSTGEKLYLLGGLITGTTSVNTVYSLDPADPNGTWVKDTPLPERAFRARPPGMAVASSSLEAPRT